MGTTFRYPDPNTPPPIQKPVNHSQLKVVLICSAGLIGLTALYLASDYSNRLDAQAKAKRMRDQVEFSNRMEAQRSQRETTVRQPIKDYNSPPSPPLTSDGIGIPILTYIVQNAKDPSSVQVISFSSVRTQSEPGMWSQTVRFRAKNSFNGYTIQTLRFLFTKDDVWGIPEEVD